MLKQQIPFNPPYGEAAESGFSTEFLCGMKQQLISIKDALWGDTMEMLETSILATGDEDATASLIDLQVRLAGLGIHGGEWTQAQLETYRLALHDWGTNNVGDPVRDDSGNWVIHLHGDDRLLRINPEGFFKMLGYSE